MKKNVVLLLILVFLSASCVITGKIAWASSKMWSQTYGGPDDDYALTMVQTSDGGYALLGSAKSFKANDGNWRNDRNSWLVKTDAFGNMEWKQIIELSASDFLSSLIQTSDGGYALAGNKDFSIYGDVYSTGGRGYDFWLVKTDEYGIIEWTRNYGGTAHDSASALVETSDGGYALTGYTWSFEPYGFWLVKTDKSGKMEWSQTYEGGVSELVETSDGGFALTGGSWLIKTDEYGKIEWKRGYGEGEYSDRVHSLIATSDGGYALVGDATTGHFSTVYSWLIKTDMYGNKEWVQKYEEGRFFSLVETSDGGFALAGDTNSFDAADYDFWLVKTNAFGKVEWNQTYGGAAFDGASSLVETFDGGFALAGSTESFGAGGSDFWLVKTVDVTPPSVSIVSQENTTYTENSLFLNFSTNEPVSWLGYSLDGQENKTITGNTTLTGLPNGNHNVTVYATDENGNTGTSTFYFLTDAPELFPTVPVTVASVAVIAVALVGLLVYFRKKQTARTTSEAKLEI